MSWTLESPALATTLPANDIPGASLATIDTGGALIPLATIDYQANYALPGTQQVAEPTLTSATIPAYTGNTVTISTDLYQVDAIASGAITYTPAANPANPRPYEFTVSGGQITLYSPPAVATPIVVLGGSETTPTDYVDPSILEIFHGLPVMAQVQWSLSAENHPSGSINLIVIGDENEALVGQRFRKGSEVSFAGIGFSITSYSRSLRNLHEAPGREWEVRISLGGKWERKKYQRPTHLLPRPEQPTAFFTIPNLDPDCAIGGQIANATRIPKPDQRSVSDFAAQLGVSFVGFSSAGERNDQIRDEGMRDPVNVSSSGGITTFVSVAKIPLKAWSIPIPADATLDDTIEWQSTADQLKRQNGAFLDYNNSDAVYARDIYSGQRWNYAIVELSISYKGDCDQVVGREGYAAEYPATKLAGDFMEPPQLPDSKQPQQPKAKWKQREVVIKEFKSGDEKISSPPENCPWIRNMNLAFDTSGPTKEEVVVRLFDGIELWKRRTVWGLLFNSDQVMQDDEAGEPLGNSGRKRGPVIARSSDFWQIVQQEITVTDYDPNTRYILGTKTTGFRYGRFKQESDELEVLDFIGSSDPEDEYMLSLYRFKKFPVYSVEKKRLAQFTSFYADARKEPIPVEFEKKCNADGTSSQVPIRNPNWVEPMFAIASLSYSNSFAHTHDPDSEPPENPLPDLTQGEERQTYTTIRVLPSKNTTFSDTSYRSLAYDTFIERHHEQSTQGAGFGEFTSKRTFSANDGRPQAAQRMPDLYEKEEPEDNKGNPNIYSFTTSQRFEYILTTPGHDPDQPSEGSLSYPYTQHLSQAIFAAETDLKYRDIQESIDYSTTIPANFQIRPMDYISLSDGVNGYNCRVVSVNNTILIQGQVDDYPLLVAPQNTEISCGIDRSIPVTLTKRNLPTPPTPPNPKPEDPNAGGDRSWGLSIGDAVPKNLQGRGNY